RPANQQRLDLHGCGWLSRLLPELTETGMLPAPTWTLPPEQERRLIFAAVGQLLANVAGPAGTLLLLDDMQWAGADALALLAALIRDAPDPRHLRVIASYRQSDIAPEDGLAALEADLTRERLTVRLPLGPLRPDEAATLLDALLVDDPGAAERERMLRLASGVPYFLVSIASEAGPATTGKAAAVPWSVAASIRQRVVALSELAREVVALAALGGARVPQRVMLQAAAALGYDETDCVAAVEAAVHAQLLVEVGEDGYACAHDLIREAVAADLTVARRRFLHRLLGEAMERLPEPERVRECALLAWHFTEAREPGRALPYALLAGDRAERVYAHIEAEDHYRLAASLANQLHHQVREAEALDKLGTVLLRLARFDAARRTLEQAIAHYRASGDIECAARALAHLAEVHTLGGTHEEGIALVQAQIQTLDREGVSPARLAQLQLSLGTLYQATRQFAAMLAAAERAAELARAGDDRRLVAQAAWQRSFVLQFMGRGTEAIPEMEDAVPLLEAVGDGDTYFWALANLSATFLGFGDVGHARLYLDRALVAAEQLGDPSALAWQAILEGEMSFALGEWSQARRAHERAATLLNGGLASWGEREAAYLAFIEGTLTMAQGSFERGERLLAEAVAWGQQRRDYQILRAALAELAERDLLAGEAQLARERLQPVLVDLHGHEEADVTHYLPLLAWSQLELGAQEDADRLAAEALARVRAGQWHRALADVLRVRALVSMRLERWPEAAEALDEALAVARAFPRPYVEAKLLYVYGLLHTETGEPERARERFAAALALCERLGEGLYRPLIERALAGLDATLT
ncbi:MAG TPA: tetratricopeptide repeat protein, partial [Ktedonobacterales bacterium]|nr:tetratricopeptide repeat protein [Ktedonobacterales bacterium]